LPSYFENISLKKLNPKKWDENRKFSTKVVKSGIKCIKVGEIYLFLNPNSRKL